MTGPFLNPIGSQVSTLLVGNLKIVSVLVCSSVRMLDCQSVEFEECKSENLEECKIGARLEECKIGRF